MGLWKEELQGTGKIYVKTKYRLRTVCPRSRYPFYMISYNIKWVTTSWKQSKKMENIHPLCPYILYIYLLFSFISGQLFLVHMQLIVIAGPCR